MKIPELHTGNMLREFLRKKRYRIAPLARDMNRRPETISDYFKRPSIHTRILLELSIALKYNFFYQIGTMLPAEFPPDISEEKDKEIDSFEMQCCRKVLNE